MKKYGEKRKMNVIFYKNRVIFVENSVTSIVLQTILKQIQFKPKKYGTESKWL